MYRAGLNVINPGDGSWIERIPRNASKMLMLNMFDGGHGETNPVLRGLGTRLVLDLGPSTRSFTVTLQYGSLYKSLTSRFKLVAPRRYEMEAVFGDPASLGFDGITDEDFQNTAEFLILIQCRNIIKTNTITYRLRINDPVEFALAGMPTENTDDFPMFEIWQRAGFRIWSNVNQPDYDQSYDENFLLWAPQAIDFTLVEYAVDGETDERICPAYGFSQLNNTGILFTRRPDKYGIAPGITAWDGQMPCDSYPMPPIECEDL